MLTEGLKTDGEIERLLHRRRRPRPPALSEDEILAWADDFFATTGRWPHGLSGHIPNSDDTTWLAVDLALKNGNRGPLGGSSLARLLNEQRGVRNNANMPRIKMEEILRYADMYNDRNGSYPSIGSNDRDCIPGETWRVIDRALRLGLRGLSGGSSLARLLLEHRGKPYHLARPKLSDESILGWCDDHFDRNGRWPSVTSGPISSAPGETWLGVGNALRAGLRGLPGGNSLGKLLLEYRGHVHRMAKPRLTEEMILGWCDEHLARTGKWPRPTDGSIAAAPAKTWSAVDADLLQGWRGLPGGSSLDRLRVARRDVRRGGRQEYVEL